MKKDGHTHTEYCPHGTVEDTELLIQRAIELGFTHYSVTEHAPLPPGIEADSEGPADIFTTASMSLTDINHYFKRMNSLKKKYASEIVIHIGFELDYFSEYESWTTDFLNEYGPLTDDGVLSVHYLPGLNGLRGIDYSFEEYKTGIVVPAGSFQNAQTLYYQRVLASLEADLGKWKPRRLGHISLCNKFQNFFTEDTSITTETMTWIEQLLLAIKEQHFQLDLNTAGFYKEGYQQSYPQEELIKKAQALGIPFIFGSDAHALSDVGHGYDRIRQWL